MQRTGERLILTDGTIIENGQAGYSSGRLWLWVTDMTMIQAATIFMDTEKTGYIEYQYGEMSDTYEGYTSCRNIFIDDDGKISICLVRG